MKADVRFESGASFKREVKDSRTDGVTDVVSSHTGNTWSVRVSEWFLNGTSAHIRLFSALQW